jgi:flagellar assembly factor FliW
MENLMKVKTKAFGEIEVSEKQLLFFKEGLFGFEDIHKFVMLDTESGSPFYWLQALDITEIAFLVIEPKMVLPTYKLEVDPKDISELEIKNDEDLLVLSIVTIYDSPQNITVNLLGPLVLNRMKHIGKQIISNNDKYSVRHPLLTGKGE